MVYICLLSIFSFSLAKTCMYTYIHAYIGLFYTTHTKHGSSYLSWNTSMTAHTDEASHFLKHTKTPAGYKSAFVLAEFMYPTARKLASNQRRVHVARCLISKCFVQSNIQAR